MSIVISGGLRQTVILLSGASAVAVAIGIGWEQIRKFKPIPSLVDLVLSGALFNGTASSGTLVGARAGSTFTLGGTPPTGLSIASTGGTYTWTGAGSGTGIFTITETNGAAPGSPHTTTIHWSITSAGGGVTLGALTFSSTTFTVGTPSSGTIIGATATSTIAASGLPAGLTINGAARTWAWDGTGTASTGSFTLTETLAGATNTPRSSTISYTISAATTINAPSYALQSASGVSPASWNVTGDSTFQPGMYVHQQFATNSGFTTGVTDYYTQVEGSDWEASSDTIGNGLVTFSQPSGTYFTRCRFETVPGDSTNNVVSAWSNTVTDTLATNLIVNGTFADTTAWTLGSGVTISGGLCNATGGGQICWQPITYVNGGTYQLDLDYTSGAGSSGGKLRANLSSTNGADVVATSPALTIGGAVHHLTLSFTANVGSGFISLEADTATFTGTLDNITLVRTA